eukprot:scaffold240424_cov28-Tisochrysis_lutea.AAC.2
MTRVQHAWPSNFRKLHLATSVLCLREAFKAERSTLEAALEATSGSKRYHKTGVVTVETSK